MTEEYISSLCEKSEIKNIIEISGDSLGETVQEGKKYYFTVLI